MSGNVFFCTSCKTAARLVHRNPPFWCTTETGASCVSFCWQRQCSGLCLSEKYPEVRFIASGKTRVWISWLDSRSVSYIILTSTFHAVRSARTVRCHWLQQVLCVVLQILELLSLCSTACKINAVDCSPDSCRDAWRMDPAGRRLSRRRRQDAGLT
jgi:hypothetical protein